MTEREELLLLVWERQHCRAEEKGFLLRRVECPELVLDFAKDPFEFQLLMQSIIFDRRTDTQYRLPRNAAWERLNDATKSSLPPSRAVRAFTEDARLARALFLAQFVVELLKALVRRLDNFSLKPAHSVAFTGRHAREGAVHHRKGHCTYCRGDGARRSVAEPAQGRRNPRQLGTGRANLL